ncbi:MAG: single-stranded DNA-binding protein [Ignavibacteriae bacterium]|nr:MAG: single-stranded DNA-binding protein [Ignavibacteriota bacterium]
MAKDLNKVTLIGRLGQDPELKYTQSGIAVTKFSMATSMSWKDQDGNNQEKTEWHNIVVWRKLAEICAEYLKKGSKVYCEGSLKTESWEDENKKKHYRTEIVMNDMIMLDSKGQTDMGNGGHTQQPGTSVQDTGAATVKDDDLPF